MAIDPETRRPRMGNITGGLSGPAIKPIALRMVYEASHAVEHPGDRHGRHHHRSRRDRVPAGRRGAVQVGTASFWDPCATEKIVDGLEGWCVEHRVDRIADLIGALQTD